MIKLVLQALFDLTGKLLNSMFWKNDSKGLEDLSMSNFILFRETCMLGRIVTTVCYVNVSIVMPIIKNFFLYAERKRNSK